jgi:hypothetical protein
MDLLRFEENPEFFSIISNQIYQEYLTEQNMKRFVKKNISPKSILAKSLTHFR